MTTEKGNSSNKKEIMVRISLVLFFSILFLSPSFAQEVLTIRGADYPPQYYKDKNGEWTGLDIELGKALVREAGFIPKVVNLPWSRSFEELKAGTLHVMMYLSITKERLEFLHFIGPERYARMGLIVKKENISLTINSIDDLYRICKEKKKNWGIQKDVFYSYEFTKRINNEPAFAQCFESITEAELNIRKTAYERILGFIEDVVTHDYMIRTNPKYKGLAVHPFLINKDPAFFGISKKVSVETLVKLYAAYERLQANGTIDKIRNTPWGENNSIAAPIKHINSTD